MELIVVSGIQVLALMALYAADHFRRAKVQDVARPDGDGWLDPSRRKAPRASRLPSYEEFDAAA